MDQLVKFGNSVKKLSFRKALAHLARSSINAVIEQARLVFVWLQWPKSLLVPEANR